MSETFDFPDPSCLTEGVRSEQEMEDVFDSIEVEKSLEDVIQSVVYLGKWGNHFGSTRRVYEYQEDSGTSGYFDRQGEEYHSICDEGVSYVGSSSRRQMFSKEPTLQCCSRCGADEEKVNKRGTLVEKRYNVPGHLLPPFTNTEYVRSVDNLSFRDMGDPNGIELICRSCCLTHTNRPYCMDCGYSEILSVQNGGEFFEKDDRPGSQGWRCTGCLHIHIFGHEYVMPGFEDVEYLPPLGNVYYGEYTSEEEEDVEADVYQGEYELDDEEEEKTSSEKVNIIKDIVRGIGEVSFEIKDDIKEENNYLKLMDYLKKLNDNVKLLD